MTTANDNTCPLDGTPLEDLLVGDWTFRMYLLDDGRVIVSADDIHKFFAHPNLTNEMVQDLKEAMEERLDART